MNLPTGCHGAQSASGKEGVTMDDGEVNVTVSCFTTSLRKERMSQHE
jgi:hypothetical protein